MFSFRVTFHKFQSQKCRGEISWKIDQDEIWFLWRCFGELNPKLFKPSSRSVFQFRVRIWKYSKTITGRFPGESIQYCSSDTPKHLSQRGTRWNGTPEWLLNGRWLEWIDRKWLVVTGGEQKSILSLLILLLVSGNRSGPDQGDGMNGTRDGGGIDHLMRTCPPCRQVLT